MKLSGGSATSAFTNLPIGAKFAVLSAFLCLSFALALFAAAQSFAPIADRSRADGMGRNAASAAAEAFQQWTIDDEQSNMYAALVALDDPTQQALAATTIGQAYAARKAVDPQLATIERSVNDRASLDLVGRIRRDLRE